MNTQNYRSIWFGLTFFLIQSVRADVIYNNFGANNSYNGSVGNSVGWTSTGAGASPAVGFLVTGGYYSLSSVSLPLAIMGGTNNLAIFIVADNGGRPGETPLETLVTHPTDVTTAAGIVTYSSSLNPVLVDGGYYWLVATPIDLNVLNSANDSQYFWNLGPVLGTSAGRNFNFTTENWNDWQIFLDGSCPAFRIEGTLVPEPGTLSLLLLGAGFFGFQGWRKFQCKAK